MILENEFVKIDGASDLEDSSMAAGMCVVFEYPIAVNLMNYFDENLMYRRCLNSKYLFSRDQAVCLVAGLSKQGLTHLVDSNKINGKDILSPSVIGHIVRCKNLSSNWFQNLWFWGDLWFSAKIKPLEELNQLFCMLMLADEKYIKWYVKANPLWEKAMRDYWYGWRNEPEFVEHVIKKIKLKNPEIV